MENQIRFEHYPLRLVEPKFGSNLTKLIIDLDYMRRRILAGSTSPAIFFQLKNIFHMLESIGSARIEGNNTTIAEYIETKIGDGNKSKAEGFKEISNMEEALSFIDDNTDKFSINRSFVSELHKMVVKELSVGEEGDPTPGEYRKHAVGIKNSKHIPPPNEIIVNQYMEELFAFINDEHESQFDLLKAAIAHHRFVWIHPFRNGNGRTVRLFTYAMLIKQGFRVDMGKRILNPTAVFCSNRDQYYDKLSKADLGTDEGTLEWCEYVLGGLKNEIEKVDKLLDYKFLKTRILIPALEFSVERKLITDEEDKVLRIVVEKQEIQAGDIKAIFHGKDPSIISRQIKKLTDKQMLMPVGEKRRKYTFRFGNNYLIRGIMSALGENGFLPDKKMEGNLEK